MGKLVDIPLFRMFTPEQLAQITPYSVVYLRDLQTGHQRIRPRFKRHICRMIGLSEAELFGDPNAPVGGPQNEP